MSSYPTLFLTQRGKRHQQRALEAAPEELAITILWDPDRAQVLDLLPQMHFLISERSGGIDAQMIAAGKKLRLIQRLGSQTWDIDLEAARTHNIPVCYSPIPGSIAVAEHVLMSALALLKKLPVQTDAIQHGIWSKTPRRSDEDIFAYNWSRQANVLLLWRQTLSILGFGEIGVELARRLQGFGVSVLYNKRQQFPIETEERFTITYAHWKALLQESDMLVSLLPYSPENDQCLNRDFFHQMKPGAFFIHCGGSGVVEEDALLAALQEGHLAGAALDTFTYEPLPQESPLLKAAADPNFNLLLTPHTAAGADPRLPQDRREDYANILHLLRGEPLQYRIV